MTETDSNDMRWHAISGDLLLESLKRVERGETADMVYMELWANSDHERVDGSDD